MTQPRVEPRARAAAPAHNFLDWINIAAGIWLILSPWVIGATAVGAWNAWITGAVIAIVAFMALGSTRERRDVATRAGTTRDVAARDSHQVEWVNVAAAVWLFVSPWVLEMIEPMAWNSWIVAVIVFAVAIGGATASPHRTYAATDRGL